MVNESDWTVRDALAMAMSGDELKAFVSAHMDAELKTKLVGRPKPEIPIDTSGQYLSETKWRIEMLRWDLQLLAVIRYMYADALMEVRNLDLDRTL